MNFLLNVSSNLMINNIKILDTTILSDNWYILRKITYEYVKKNGTSQVQTREAYDRGNGATILLYNKSRSTVILTLQFRLPTYINGNVSGMLIESCAGLLDKDNPEDCIRRETEEETGYKVTDVRKVYEAYMSPGSVTEMLHFFIAEYAEDMKIHDGGGIEHEEENIEVLEVEIKNAMDMIDKGEIRDGKTIMLLQYIKLHNIL
jgi:GDP-mannose pyrophosphatase NudK